MKRYHRNTKKIPYRYSDERKRIAEKYGYLDAPPAEGGDYLIPFKAAVRLARKLGMEFVGYARVSARSQKRGDGLDNQEDFMRLALGREGFLPPKIFRECESGWKDTLAVRQEAAAFAAKNNAILIVLCPNRILRSTKYKHNASPATMPNKAEWDTLFAYFHSVGVLVTSILDPDVSEREMQSFQIQLGKNGVHCETNEKKHRREKLKQRAIDLREKGESWRKIAKEIAVPSSTVRAWVKNG